MGTARPGATAAPVSSPLANEHAAWGFLLGECGRTKDEVYVLCACGDLGINLAQVVRGVLQRPWLLGGHGPGAKAEPGALPPLPMGEEFWPEGLKDLGKLAGNLTDVLRQADALIRAAKAVLPVLQNLASRDRSRLQHEGQMMCALVLLSAEQKDLKQPTSMEMACIALLLGEKLQVPEVQRRFANAEARAEAWEKQIRKVKRLVLPLLRRLALFYQPAGSGAATQAAGSASAQSPEAVPATSEPDPG